MEKAAYGLKGFFTRINSFFHSTGFLKVYDKVVKFLKSFIPHLCIYAILIAFCYVFLYPILRVLVDSIKTESDLVNPDVVWLPHSVTLKSYKDAFSTLWIFRRWPSIENAWMSTLLNSVFFALLSGILQTFVSCLAGYAFARFNFKGKKIWFAGLIIAFVLPTQLLTLPRSMMLRPLINYCSSASKVLGIPTNYQIDGTFSVLTTLPTILLTALGQGINSSILIFIFYSFFKMIPIALDEAAQIDGANFFQIFYHIIIKMSVPTILVVFLFSFIWNWNDTYVINYLSAIADNNLGFRSLPQALDSFNYVISQGSSSSGIQEGDGNNAGLKSAGIIVSILPLIILYIFTQRKFVEGIENTGVTGV